MHEAERGDGTWATAISGLVWLAAAGLRIAVAGRRLPGESESQARAGYAALFERLGLPLDAADPERLVLFPEMDASARRAGDHRALLVHPGQIAGLGDVRSSRMVVRRRGEASPRVSLPARCCPTIPSSISAPTLAEADRPVHLNHPHCARFCVLGGAAAAPRALPDQTESFGRE